jgi:hypothetical protein
VDVPLVSTVAILKQMSPKRSARDRSVTPAPTISVNVEHLRSDDGRQATADAFEAVPPVEGEAARVLNTAAMKFADARIRDALLADCGSLSEAERTAVERAMGLRVAFENSTNCRPITSPYAGTEMELGFLEGSSLGFMRAKGFIHGADPAAVCAYRMNSGRWSLSSLSLTLVDAPSVRCQVVYAQGTAPPPFQVKTPR